MHQNVSMGVGEPGRGLCGEDGAGGGCRGGGQELWLGGNKELRSEESSRQQSRTRPLTGVRDLDKCKTLLMKQLTVVFMRVNQFKWSQACLEIMKLRAAQGKT